MRTIASIVHGPLLALAALVVVPAAAPWAHHSQSEFDLSARVEVEGTVTKLEWKSPHGRLYVDVKNGKGEVVTWNFELPSPNTLMRRGWTRDTLKAGDRVTVAGAPARNFPAIAVATSVKDAKGAPIFTGTTQIYEPEPESKAAP
jgi:DNA/RNA endonuclease YhcR with UshA esterase domain